MHVPAVFVPGSPVSLVQMPAEDVVGNPRLRDAWTESIAGVEIPRLMWDLAGRPPGRAREGVRDDNRSAVLPDVRYEIRGREYAAVVKGCGAEFDPYENAPLTAKRLRGICRNTALAEALPIEDCGSAGFITAERWFGNTPYGGQAPDNAILSLLASLRADANEIAGFFICPTIAAIRLPDAFRKMASRFFWYRRYDGSLWQEVRLMPSNVRLYFHSPVTFGVDTSHALALFRIASLEACESFLANLARSSIAALTLYARSLRHDAVSGCYRGLGYHDVWLDKDAVIAADGTMHFADLEGIEDIAASRPEPVREEIRRQFHRNLYEATYALEAMAAEIQRRWGIAGDDLDRRAWILDVVENACRGDPYVHIERDGKRVFARIEPATDPDTCGVELELASGEDR